MAVNLTDGKPHYLGLYFLDWDGSARSEQVQLVDAATGAVVDSQTVSSFHGGAVLDWSVSGNVLVKITRLSGSTAVLSGVFIDPPIATAQFVEEDTTTQGNWIGAYGTEGYDISQIGEKDASFATVTVTGGLSYSFVSPAPTDPRALEWVNGQGRYGSAWNASSFSVNVSLTDGLPHQARNVLFVVLGYDSDRGADSARKRHDRCSARYRNDLTNSNGSLLSIGVFPETC